MLELLLQTDPPREHLPVSAEMVDSLREVLANGVGGDYDIDAVFFNLALAVYKLEGSVVNLRTELLNLEERILQAGLRLRPLE
jgi:hypothetical protein